MEKEKQEVADALWEKIISQGRKGRYVKEIGLNGNPTYYTAKELKEGRR